MFVKNRKGQLRRVAGVDLGVPNGPNGLFYDYVTNASKGIPPYLLPFLDNDGVWCRDKRCALRALESEQQARWAAVIEGMQELNERLGVGKSILDKLMHAENREARFVVTGQQPGAMGGPLYAAYKIATAVALAAALEKQLGRPCIPLYWCGADDTDFQEIRDVHMMTRQLSMVSSSIAAGAHSGGVPVGDIDTKWLKQLWQNIGPFVKEFSSGKTIESTVEEAMSGARDHGEFAAGILTRLLGGTFAVVDGRMPAVRRYAQSIFVEYTRQEVEIKREVEENGRRLEGDGYHAQLVVGDDSGVFMLENGRRKSVSDDQRPVLIEAVEKQVEDCSPGVILRNLVQDYAFEPLAVVSGPAEIAYRAQIGSLYERLDVTRPVDFPRMGATFLPSALVEVSDAEGAPGLATLLEDPPAFARTIYRLLTPQNLTDSAREFGTVVGEAIGRLTSEIEHGIPPKSQNRIRARLRELEDRVKQTSEAILDTGRARAVERWPFLPDLALLVRPSDRPQERRLSVLVPFLHSVDAAVTGESLIALAEGYVGELLDGRPLHIVYSHQQ